MTVEKDGKLTVSIFDWNDPEHLLKKKKYEENKRNQFGIYNDNQPELTDSAERNDNDDNNDKNKWKDVDPSEDIEKYAEDGISMEQVFLFVACVMIFCIYVAAKIAFSETSFGEEGAL